MAADRSRFDVEGISIQGVITIARPVGAIVRDIATGNFFVSTNDATPAYAAIAGAADEFGLANAIADPGGAGAAIPVDASGYVAISTTGVGTNTLAIPTSIGQKLMLYCDSWVGARVITVAAPFNVANNNTLTFSAVSQACMLEAVSLGGALVWQMSWNDTVGVSTV